MFYYYKKDKIEKGILFCVYQSDSELTEDEIKDINGYQDNILLNTVVYYGEIPFIGYPILNEKTIRRATDKELINLKKIKLGEGEVLVGDNIEIIEKPSDKYKWDYTSYKWTPNKDMLDDGEIISGDEIIYVPCPKEYLINKWDRDNGVWINLTTSLDIAKFRYDEYLLLDTPLNLARLEKKGLRVEYEDMMNKLFDIICRGD